MEVMAIPWAREGWATGIFLAPVAPRPTAMATGMPADPAARAMVMRAGPGALVTAMLRPLEVVPLETATGIRSLRAALPVMAMQVRVVRQETATAMLRCHRPDAARRIPPQVTSR